MPDAHPELGDPTRNLLHLTAYEPEAEAGDYEGLVRKAARIVKAAEAWRASMCGVTCPHLAELDEALEDANASRAER